VYDPIGPIGWVEAGGFLDQVLEGPYRVQSGEDDELMPVPVSMEVN
jgi:hypothetical protein